MKVLKEIGLTDNEINIYLALLQIGSSTATPIARKSKVHRSRVYESLNRLIEKGLVSYKIKSNRKYFEAQNPETIIDLLEEKKNEVKEILPKLKELQLTKPDKQEANVFDGYKGLKSVMQNAINQLKKGEEILIFGARGGQDLNPEVWHAFFKQINKKRLNKGIKYKVIFNEDLRDKAIAKTFQKSKLTEVRFIKQHTPAGINIHGNNVAIVNWDKLITFLITSKEVSSSFREYFKIMWQQAKR